MTGKQTPDSSVPQMPVPLAAKSVHAKTDTTTRAPTAAATAVESFTCGMSPLEAFA